MKAWNCFGVKLLVVMFSVEWKRDQQLQELVVVAAGQNCYNHHLCSYLPLAVVVVDCVGRWVGGLGLGNLEIRERGKKGKWKGV